MTENGSAIFETLRQQFGNRILDTQLSSYEPTVEIATEAIKEILAFLKQTPEPGYEFLIDLTAVDYLQPKPRTKVVYFLYNPTTHQRLRVFISAKRLSVIPSVTDLWKGANWYECELYDLFGLHFEDHPDLKRILMPDDWSGHPLLRDYALTEEPVEFKHGVMPKTPSQIIKGTYGDEKNNA